MVQNTQIIAWMAIAWMAIEWMAIAWMAPFFQEGLMQ